MTQILAVLKETAPFESRVAATPDSVKKLIGLGMTVQVQAGAGAACAITDDAFAAAGATLCKDAAATLKGAAFVLCVQRPAADILDKLPEGACLIGLLGPYQFDDALPALEKKKASALALELVPRTTRAQSMDVLSSQANLAGYRAVIEAAAAYGRAFPMMMTAAGTIAPAKVFVMGAGVAGLQAIATARRLGAVVSATDVRPAAREQVQSLGASFVMVETEETKAAETSGGYAKDMSDDYKRQQAALVADTIRKQDIVITTALIPGRPAPVLVTEDMVKTMRAGSAIVDLAVEQGGNCPLSQAGKIIEKHDVKIIGYSNMAGRVATDASALYARNMLNVLTLMHNKDTQTISLTLEDDILKAITLVHEGARIHPLVASNPTADKTKKKAS